jgi:hypothetical protein
VKVDSERELCARLLRALAHRIRGDLSVVTNDLSYISTLIDPVEVERSQERCRKIASELGVLRVLTGGFEMQAVALPVLCSHFGISDVQDSLYSNFRVSLDEKVLKQTVVMMTELLGGWSSSVEEANGEFSGVSIRLEWRPCDYRLESVSSFSAGVSSCIGERGVVPAVLVDFVFRAFGWSTEMFGDGDTLTLEVFIPYADGVVESDE